jgi:hypothetical protein
LEGFSLIISNFKTANKRRKLDRGLSQEKKLDMGLKLSRTLDIFQNLARTKICTSRPNLSHTGAQVSPRDHTAHRAAVHPTASQGQGLVTKPCQAYVSQPEMNHSQHKRVEP